MPSLEKLRQMTVFDKNWTVPIYHNFIQCHSLRFVNTYCICQSQRKLFSRARFAVPFQKCNRRNNTNKWHSIVSVPFSRDSVRRDCDQDHRGNVSVPRLLAWSKDNTVYIIRQKKCKGLVRVNPIVPFVRPCCPEILCKHDLGTFHQKKL
jgi:hypothetical protein